MTEDAIPSNERDDIFVVVDVTYITMPTIDYCYAIKCGVVCKIHRCDPSVSRTFVSDPPRPPRRLSFGWG